MNAGPKVSFEHEGIPGWIQDVGFNTLVVDFGGMGFSLNNFGEGSCFSQAFAEKLKSTAKLLGHNLDRIQVR